MDKSDKDIQEFIESQRKYKTPGGIMETVLAVSSAEASYKYLLMCKHLKECEPNPGEEDLEFLVSEDLLTPDMISTFRLLRDHCADFIKTFDLFKSELEEDFYHL